MRLDALFPCFRRAAAKRRDTSRVIAVAVGLCAIAVVWAAILASLSAQREEALGGAALNAENLARAFEENIVRTFSALDQSLRSLRRAYVRNQPHFDIGDWASATRAVTEMTVQFAVTDKNGIVTAGTLTAPGERVDLSSRPHFLAERNSPNDELFISQPIVGQASRKTVLVVARKLLAPDGRFDGIVLGSLDLDYLAGFYRSVNIGRLGIVQLVGQDGVVRVRAGGNPADDAAAIGRNNSTANLLAHFARARSGEFTAPSQTDGVTRIFAYRGTRGFPLIVQVGIARSEALARYDANARIQYILGGVVTMLAAAVMTMYLVRDTQLKRARDEAEARYADKARLLARTVANISQGILVVGADNRVQLCNQRLKDMLELPDGVPATGEPIEHMLHWLWTHDEFEDGGSDFETWAAGFLTALRSPSAARRHEHTRPDGVVLDIRSTLMPDGCVVRSFTDITSSRLEAQMLHAAREGATRATEAKSAFLAMMSHEIRSPLAGLLGVLDLLRTTQLDAEQSRMAGMIHASGRLLLAVLNDVLDFSKIEAGALSVTPEPADLHAVLADTVQPHVLPGRERGITVSLSIDEAVPRLVLTDKMRLAQIVGNLLSNAMKFTAAGSVTVRAEAVAEETGARTLLLTIRDTGIGMDAGTVSRLFKPFSQADGSITRKYGGTGLGLCISQQLAKLLGGGISVSSQPGEGSAFCVTLPCVACAAQDSVPAAPDEPETGREIGAGLRALLVDDDPTNRWLGQNLLRRLGFEVDVAEDGEAGLAAFRASRYDLLVTDLHMPRLCGVGLTAAVRDDADPARRDLPIIGLTADTTDEQRRRCQQAGITELAVKPITAAKLAALIARLLPKQADTAPGPAPPPVSGAPPGLLECPFDPRIYLDMLPRGDPDGAAWLRDYLETARQEVDALGALLGGAAAGTSQPAPALADVKRVAHRLAGASFSVGATLLGQAARALERAADHDTTPALLALLDDLRSKHDAATRAIDDFLCDDRHASRPAA